MKLNYIYALIVLECRLSRKQACTLFSKSNEELDEFFHELSFSHPMLYEALKYVFNHETVMPNEKREKKAMFLAKIYLRKLQKILNIEDKNAKNTSFREFISTLGGPDIAPLLNKKICWFTSADKELLVRFQVKYALSNGAMARKFRTGREVIVNMGRKVEDEKLQYLYQELYDYYAIKTAKLAPYCAQHEHKR